MYVCGMNAGCDTVFSPPYPVDDPVAVTDLKTEVVSVVEAGFAFDMSDEGGKDEQQAHEEGVFVCSVDEHHVLHQVKEAPLPCAA